MAKTMMKYLFAILILLSRFSFACDSPGVQSEMAKILYQNKEFREFTCGAVKDCDAATMAERMEFTAIKVRGVPYTVCSAETAVNVKNRFTGIFILDGLNIRFHMIVFDTDVKPFYKKGRAGLIVDLVTDDVTESGESELYGWNGKDFLSIEHRDVLSPQK